MTQPPWGRPAPRPTAWPPPRASWPQQQPWPQQGFQPQGWPSGGQTGWPPPRRPRGPGLLGMAFRLALVVVGLVVLASLLRGLQGGGTGTTAPGGTQTAPSGGATQAPGTSPYVNERYSPPPPDLNPPGIPGPRDLAAATALTQQNPLYAQEVPVPTRCDLPQVDGTSASRAQLEGHLNALMGCLMTVWEGPVTEAGFTLPRPPVVVYNSAVNTACGTFEELNAAYCAGDQRVYYAQPLLRAFPPAIRRSPYAVEMIIAHEFGHALQARTAILASEIRLEQRAATEAAGNELSRRTEVQADCLAGQFVRSVAQSQQLGSTELASLGEFTYNLGDDVLSGRPGWSEGHGLGSSRQDWFQRGLGASEVATCNSFVAPSGQVR